MAEEILESGSGELNPITQQPTYSRKAPKPIIKSYFLENYNASRGSVPIQTPVGQYFPEEITSTLEDIPDSRLMDIPEYQAEKQSTTDKWANATAKMGITALTTFADGTIGTILGLTNIDGEDKNGNPLSDFVNNPFSRAMLDVGDWAERVLPNYYTQQEQERPWYENLGTANFWADKVLKNFGFAIGAYASGALTAGAGSYLSGANKLARGMSSKIGKGLMTKVLTGNLDEVGEKAILTELATRGVGVTDDLVKGLIQEGKQLKKLSLQNQIIGSVGGSVGEARIEAGHAIREFVETNTKELDAKYQAGQISDENYQKELEDIQSKALTMGNHVFALNVAVLSASNFAQFRHAFAGGYDTQLKAINKAAITGGVKEGAFKTALPTTKLAKTLAASKGLAIGLKNAMVEGNEEMLQRVASEGSKDHYNKMLDGKEGGADEFINSIWNGFKNTYGNIDAWEEFVIGAFSGGIGIPTIQNKKLKVTGGIASDIREQFGKNKRTEAVVANLNKIIQSDAFKNRYYSANTDMAAEQAKDGAIKRGDKFEWKTQDDIQLSNMVNAFYNAGQLDQLYDWIDGIENATAEDLKTVTTITKGKDADGKVVEGVEPTPLFENWTDEEIVAYNKKRAQALRQKVKDVREVREAVDIKFGSVLNDEGKSILTSQLVALKDIDRREQDLHESLRLINNLRDGRKITDISKEVSSLALEQGWLNTFNNKARATKGQITRLSNLVSALEEKIKGLEGGKDVSTGKTSRTEATIKAASMERYKNKLREYKQEIEVREKDLEKSLADEFEARKKVVETSPELYQDLTFEEYRNRVLTLSDKIDEFEESVKKSYDRVGETPESFGKREEVQTILKDLTKLNILRDRYLKSYTDSVQKLQKDPKAFQKLREEVQNELADKEADSMINRILSGADKLKNGFLVKNENGDEFRVKKVGNETVVLGKNSAGSFSMKTGLKVDREFVKTHVPSSEYVDIPKVLDDLVKDGKATLVDANQSGISIAEDKLVASGILYSYTPTKKDKATGQDIKLEEKYLRTPDGKFYKIYNEGDASVLGTKSYTEDGLKEGNLTSTNKGVTVPFEGTILENSVTGEKFLVKSEHLPELDAKIKSEELAELSDVEQAKANIEAEELEDELGMSTPTEIINNPNKVILVLTKYIGKDAKGNWITKVEEIKDTPEGRAKRESLLSAYAKENDGASLIGDIFTSIKERSSNPSIEINGLKYYISLPKNPPKKIVLVARDRKTRAGKVTWGKAITITDSTELAQLAKDIKTSSKGSKYVIKGKKFYFVKEVDYLGDNVKYTHWKYKYNFVIEKDGKFFTTPFGKPEIEITGFKEFLASAKEGVDYIKTKDGKYKVFRKIDTDETTKESTISESFERPKQVKDDRDNWRTGMFNMYGDLGELSHIEIHDNKYTAVTKNGDKIGIPRKQWKYPITTVNGVVDFGKASEFDYLDRKYIFKDNTQFGTVSDSTEPSGEKGEFDPIPKFEVKKGALFASTFAPISPIIGDSTGIDAQEPKVKRFTGYVNNNNLRDGNHSIMILSGTAVGDVANPNSVKIVITKKIEGVFKPIDKDGNAIEIADVYEKGIFQETPLPENFSAGESVVKKGSYAIRDIRSSNDNNEISIPTNKKAVEDEVNRYKNWYATISKQVLAEGYQSKNYDILDVTNGKNLRRTDGSFQSTETSLPKVTGNKNNIKLHIGTKTRTALFVNNKFVNLKPGYVYIEDLTTGNLYQLQTNKITQEQQDTVIQILKVFVGNFKVTDEGKINMEGAHMHNGTNLFRDGIENIVFFQDRNNITKEGIDKLEELENKLVGLNLNVIRFLNNPEQEVRDLAKAERDLILKEYKAIVEGTLPAYRINSNPKTQFYFKDSRTVPGGLIVIGGEKDGKVLPLLDQSDIKAKRLNPEVETALREFLANRNFNVVKTKDKLNNDSPFRPVVYKDGELKYGEEFESYNDYVIKNTTTDSLEYEVDGTTITTVAKKIIWDVKDSDIETPKPSATTTTPDASVFGGKLSLDPEKVKSAKINREIDFDRTEDEEGVESSGASAEDFTGTTTNTKPKFNPDNNPFAGLRVKRGTKVIPEDTTKFLSWIEEKFGKQFADDFVRIETVIVDGRWGEFSDNIIRLFADAELGTGYHESFHAVVKMFLSPTEYNRMIQQLKTDKRFADRIAEAKRLYPGYSEEYQLEEALAEEFRDFVLTEGKSLENRKQPKAKGIFGLIQRILDWITGRNKDVINEVFSRINSGYYKNAEPNLNKGIGINKARVKVKNSKQFESDAMQTVSGFFFRNLFDNNIVKDGLYELFGKEGINPTITKSLYDKTLEDVKSLYKYYDQFEEDALIKTYKEGLQYLIDNWDNEIVPAHKQYLSKYGIEEEVLETEVLEGYVNNENSADRSESGAAYNYSSLKVSAKASSTRLIKALIGGLVAKDSTGVVRNNIGGTKMAEFGRVFSILSNHLVNTTTPEEKLSVLESLENKIPEVSVLIDRLKLRTFVSNPLSLNAREIELIAKFNQTFSKNMNKYVYALLGSDGQYNLQDANAETLVGRVKGMWKARFSKSIEGLGKNKIIKRSGVVLYNPQYYSKFGNGKNLSKEPEVIAGFLKAVGIYVDESMLTNVSKGTDFIDTLYKAIMLGNQSIIFSNTADANFTGRFNEFLELAVEDSVDYVENAHFNLNKDLVYNNTVNSPISIMFNKINRIRKNSSKEDIAENLVKELPFLNPSWSYNRNSLILKTLLGVKSFNINMFIHEGNRIEGEDGKAFGDFSSPERLYSWYQAAKDGYYVLMRPSDNGIERFIKLPPSVFGMKNDNEVFEGYLRDEMTFAADKSNFRFQNFAKNRYRGIIMDIIAKTDATESIYAEMKAAIDNNTVEEFIKLHKNRIITDSNSIIKTHLKERTAATKAAFELYGINSRMLNADYPIDKFVKEHLWSAIEQTKVITGNISLFKNMADMYKRNSGVANTKKISWVGKQNDSIEKWIRTKYKRLDKSNPNDSKFWYNDMPILNTMIINDVKASTKYVEEYEKVLGDRVEPYQNYDETDGFSFMSADEHREMHVRSGDWSQELEDLYQYEMQTFLHHMAMRESGNRFKTEFKRLFGVEAANWTVPINLETGEPIKVNSKIKINSVKPQYRGPMAVDGFIPTMYKTSFLPIYPSLFMDLKTGKVTNPNLYKLFTNMVDNGVGVVSFYSANKGASTLVNKEGVDMSDINTEIQQPLYNENGEVANFSSYIQQPTFYEYWGIQVDTGFKAKHSVVYGTQMLKQLRNGVFDKGKAFAGKEELANLVKEFEALNSKRIVMGVKALEAKLGLKFENNTWTYEDSLTKLVEALEAEAKSRNMPDNVIDSIGLLSTYNMPIDALVKSDTMQTILYAMADKLTLSQKAFGKAPYQVPSTLFEKDGIRVLKDAKGVDRVVSNDLEFYGFNEDGSVKAMEVYLPSYLKGVIDVGKVDSKLLKLIGFRIPTQGLNSIESIIVKGFLSDSYGDIIVLPSEIVAKTGSDFDIDKLNLYIPNFFMDMNGKPVYITKTAGEYYDVSGIEDFDRKVLENEMFEKMNEIILHKDNARQLLNPIDSDNHKILAKELRSATNREVSTSLDSYGDVLHHLQVAKQNMEGAGAIGIAANSAVFQIYAALHDFGVVETFKNYKTKLDENGIQEVERIATHINLKHNSREDGKISLGGMKDADNELFTYEAFNAYITLTVDNAKDPILDDLNAGLKTINTVLYLVMAGVPYRTIHYFMNQPIILDYLTNLTKYESDILKANSTKEERLDKFSDEVLLLTLESYGFTGDKVSLDRIDTSRTYTDEELLNMVNKANKTTYNKEQINLLLDFIRYQRTATEIGKAVQGMQYDTKSFGKNEVEALDLLEMTNKVNEKGVVLGFEKAFTEGFLGAYQDTMSNVLDRFSAFSIILRNPVIKAHFENFMAKYHDERIKIGRERRLELLNAWKKDILTFLITSKKFNMFANEEVSSPMNERIDKLFKGENSVPNRVLRIKEIVEQGNRDVKSLSPDNQRIYEFFKNNKLIEQLNPEIDLEKSIHNLTFHSRRLDALESDLITEGWSEMINANIPLGRDLIEFALLQSGLQGSPMTFVEFIPFEIYGNIVNSVISQEADITDATNYAVQFYINNYLNDDIVKKVTTSQHERFLKGKRLPFTADLYPVYKVYTPKDEYKNTPIEKLIEMRRKGINPWKSKPTLHLTSNGKEIPDFGNIRAFRNKESLMVYGTKGMNAFTKVFLENSKESNMNSIVPTVDRIKSATEWQDKNCK